MLIDIFWACAVFNSDCPELLVPVRIFLYLHFLSYVCFTSFSGFSKSVGLFFSHSVPDPWHFLNNLCYPSHWTSLLDLSAFFLAKNYVRWCGLFWRHCTSTALFQPLHLFVELLVSNNLVSSVTLKLACWDREPIVFWQRLVIILFKIYIEIFWFTFVILKLTRLNVCCFVIFKFGLNWELSQRCIVLRTIDFLIFFQIVIMLFTFDNLTIIDGRVNIFVWDCHSRGFYNFLICGSHQWAHVHAWRSLGLNFFLFLLFLRTTLKI